MRVDVRAVAPRVALDLDQLHLAAGRPPGLRVVAAQLHRYRPILHTVHQQHGYVQWHVRDRITDGIAVGELLWAAAHKRPHRTAVPGPLATRQVDHAGLGDRTGEAHARLRSDGV